MQHEIEALFDTAPASYLPEHFALFARFKEALNTGHARAAAPDASSPTGWRVNPWVKKGILLGFRMGTIVDMSVQEVSRFIVSSMVLESVLLFKFQLHLVPSLRLQCLYTISLMALTP